MNRVSPSAVSPTSSYTVTQHHSCRHSELHQSRAGTFLGASHSFNCCVPAALLLRLPPSAPTRQLPPNPCTHTQTTKKQTPSQEHGNVLKRLPSTVSSAHPHMVYVLPSPFMHSIKPRTLILFAGMNRTGAVYKWSNLLTVSNIHYLH